MGFISDYFLRKYVKDQYEEFLRNPPEKEIEPSTRTTYGTVHIEIDREALAKQTGTEMPKPFKDKLDAIDKEMQEIKLNHEMDIDKNVKEALAGRVKYLSKKVDKLESINSAKDHYIKVLEGELKKTEEANKQLHPSVVNYITFLQEQSVKQNGVSTKQDKSMSVSKS